MKCCLKINDKGIFKSNIVVNGSGIGNIEVRVRECCIMGSKLSCINW